MPDAPTDVYIVYADEPYDMVPIAPEYIGSDGMTDMWVVTPEPGRKVAGIGCSMLPGHTSLGVALGEGN